MFEKAARWRLRFDTTKGQLTVEDLWLLPLSASNRVNLDDIARDLHKQLKNDDDVSFVHKERKSDAIIQLKFDIVKHIIETLMAEREVALDVHAKTQKRQALLAIIAQKEEKEIADLPVEELKKMADDLK